MKPATTLSPNASRRIPELDGLRGFAILIVVLLHYFYKPGVPAPPIFTRFQSIFRLGWTGVDLFFVLSGFLIGGILLNARDSPNYFKTFYIRRFFRIIPIYYLWILLYIVVVAVAGNNLRAHINSGVLPALSFDVYEHFLFLQNIRYAGYATLFMWWLGVTWSLAVEEQFYLVIPFLIRILSIRYLYVLLMVIIAAAPVLRTYYYLHQQPLAFTAYVSSLCRSDALAIGVLAALLWRSDKFRSWLAMRRRGLAIVTSVLFAGMVALWYAFSNPYHVITITIGLSWIACFYVSVLLLALISPAGLIARAARAAWLRELGRVSFCVYLIHLAVIYMAFGLVMRRIPQITNLKCIGLAIVCAVATYLIARLSWVYIEDPLIRVGHRTLYKTAQNAAHSQGS